MVIHTVSNPCLDGCLDPTDWEALLSTDLSQLESGERIDDGHRGVDIEMLLGSHLSTLSVGGTCNLRCRDACRSTHRALTAPAVGKHLKTLGILGNLKVFGEDLAARGLRERAPSTRGSSEQQSRGMSGRLNMRSSHCNANDQSEPSLWSTQT